MGAEHSSLACITRTYPPNQCMSPLVREMHIAVMQNNISQLVWILRLGVDVNLPWSNPSQPSVKDGCTALSEAVSLNHIKIAQALLEAGASLETIDRDGFSPLQRACYHGRHIIAEMLILAGADIHELDKEENTILHLCVKNGLVHNNAECVRVLIRRGLDVNRANVKGQIPLHSAAGWSLTEIVSVLIEYGSDLHFSDNDYLTPFYCCVPPLKEMRKRNSIFLLREYFRRYLPTIMLLIKAGCDSLGLASLMMTNCQLYDCVEDKQFKDWCRRNHPESLKHLVRMYVQQRLGFTEVRHKYCLRKVRGLDVPDTLKSYLSRRLLELWLAVNCPP